MNRVEIAGNYFANGYNCSQAVFASFAPDYGLSVDNSLKIACAFGGGMGRQQQTCGAVTGALMVLGLKYGKALNDDEGKKKLTYIKTTEFFEAFKKQHGSTNCKALLDGLDMNDQIDMEQIKNRDLFNTLCPIYVVSAVEIAELLIDETF